MDANARLFLPETRTLELRPLVVLRKITIEHCRLNGGRRMVTLMSVAEATRRYGQRASRIFLKVRLH